MRGWWRFRRRNTELDDLILAYVEGRMEAAGEARLQRHLSGDPERQADVDSLRATVALLHSVAPEKAPRSFALQESPAPVARPFFRYEWAPAMASAAAAIVVGLLVLGDVTGTLTQAGAPRPQARPVATQVVEAPAMLAAPRIEPETVVEKEALLPGEAPPLMEALEAAPVEQAPAAAAPEESATLDAAEKAAAPPPAEAPRALAPEEAEAPAEEAFAAPAPMATPSPPPVVAPAPREAVAGGPTTEPPDEGGFTLPVRQLEMAFGAAAALLAAGAWFLLRRRGRRL